MSLFWHQKTRLCLWNDIFKLAEKKAGFNFDESLKHYLTVTLDFFTTQPHISQHIISMDFLIHSNAESSFDLKCLRDTGDRCLILSGLFPNFIKHKNISSSHIINIGRQAYGIISSSRNYTMFNHALFEKLRDNFPSLSKTLTHIRSF
jgi:hypothetical protein